MHDGLVFHVCLACSLLNRMQLDLDLNHEIFVWFVQRGGWTWVQEHLLDNLQNASEWVIAFAKGWLQGLFDPEPPRHTMPCRSLLTLSCKKYHAILWDRDVDIPYHSLKASHFRDRSGVQVIVSVLPVLDPCNPLYNYRGRSYLLLLEFTGILNRDTLSVRLARYQR